MKRELRLKLLFTVLTALLLLGCARPEVSYEDYTHIDMTYPEQTAITEVQEIIISGNNAAYTIWPKAEYRVGAIVRSKRTYRTDRMAQISPYDLALVWGFLADEHFYRQVRISQGGRRYFFRPKRNSQLSIDWIYLNSSNHHVIPANDNIRKALGTIRKNDRIEIEGYLVNVYANVRGNTFRWNTSLTRDDRGDGSCEIVYVKKLKVNYRVYE